MSPSASDGKKAPRKRGFFSYTIEFPSFRITAHTRQSLRYSGQGKALSQARRRATIHSTQTAPSRIQARAAIRPPVTSRMTMRITDQGQES